MQTLATHDQRLAWTQTFYAQLSPERLPAWRQQFGCFGCDPPDADGRVRIRFTNHDTDGTSPLSQARWGQFLDHCEAVRPVLREQLLANLAKVDMQRLWEAFPLPTYTVQAPVQAFYDLYQVGAQP